MTTGFKKQGCLILALLFASFSAVAQLSLALTGVTEKKITNPNGENIESGTNISVTSCSCNADGCYYTVVYNDKKVLISEKDFKNIKFDPPSTLKDVWRSIILETETYSNLGKNGMNYDIRNQSDRESLKFVQAYEDYGFFFDDIYLEEYLQSLLPSIHPVTLDDERPGNLSIRVVINPTPNAYCLPNGAIMITTGMLSLIDSEQELVAVIAHEVAHFVLDHYVTNILEEAKRQQRAEFWAGFATLVAVAGDAYLASKNPDHFFGPLSIGTSALAYTLADGITERLGLKYSREQEVQADKAAVQVLNYLGISPDALATVLMKLHNYSISVGGYSALNSTSTHPSINSRIAKVGKPQKNEFVEPSYYFTISNVNTANAYMEFYSHHFLESDRIVSRNITGKIATEDDFILKAKISRSLSNDNDELQSALTYLEKAEKIDVVPRIILFREKGLTLVRLKKYNEAIAAFTVYLTNLEIIEYKNNFHLDEIEWTKKMIFKCENF